MRIDETLVAAIRSHAETAYPHECCGALLGVDGAEGREVRDLLALGNQHGSSPRNRFVVTPDDVRRAERVAGERGLALVGWYHSHPDHPPLPSEFDREHAWPWYSYVIVGVAEGRGGALASWRLADNRMRFAPEPVAITHELGEERRLREARK